MRASAFLAVCVALALLLPPAAGAQDTGAADLGALAADLESMIAAMNEYVGDYRLTEADLEALRRSDLEIPDPAGDDDEEGPSLRKPDGSWDLEAPLRDPEVRAWLRASGLDGRRILRAALRAGLLEMRRSLRDAPDPVAQAEEQRRQLESARSQLDEETYREMAAAIENGIELQRRLAAAVGTIPPPTGTERELLERYRDVLSPDDEEIDEVEEEPGDW